MVPWVRQSIRKGLLIFMARIRYLKPEFFTDEDLADLSFEARLCFAGLWCYADKAGRLEDRPKFLKAMIFPYDKIDIEKILILLSQKPFINRYENDGKKYIEIPSWNRHQKPHHTEKESTLPPGPPILKENGKGELKGNGEGECDESITELSHRTITVKERLKNNNNLTPQLLASIWNVNKPTCLPAVILPLNQSRIKKALPAIRERNDPKFWEDLVLSIADTPFLLGGNDRGWRADFDFMLKSYDKISEGKYKSETRVSPTAIKNMQVMKEWLGEEKKDEPEKQD